MDLIGDTIPNAFDTGLNGGTVGTFTYSSEIGDNPDFLPGLDVHFFKVKLAAVDPLSIATSLIDEDTVLRLFDANGNELAVDDDGGPGLQSLISFTATNAGTYYIGVSEYANFSYNPFEEGTGEEAFIDDRTPNYTLTISVAPGVIAGTAGNDTLNGSDFPELISGLGGNDVITALSGNDTLDGGADNDTLDGGRGNDSIFGGTGNDSLTSGFGNDFLDGGSGNDYFIVNGYGRDTVDGGAGSDTLQADYGASSTGVLMTNNTNTGSGSIAGAGAVTTFSGIEVFKVSGSVYGDTLVGGLGNDTLDGYARNDNLNGGAGDDVLLGARAAVFGIGEIDTLTGGTGADTFTLARSNGAFYTDSNNTTAGLNDYAVITDFATSIDKIQLKSGLSYVLGSVPGSVGLNGTGIFIDNDGTSGLSAGDELVGVLKDVNLAPGAITTSTTGFVFV